METYYLTETKIPKVHPKELPCVPGYAVIEAMSEMWDPPQALVRDAPEFPQTI